MKLLKIFLTAITFMTFSVAAYATPMTATLSIDGFVDYNADGDGVGSNLDGLFGDDVWTYYGEFDFATSVTGTPPAFSENVNWYLSGEGDYSLSVNGSRPTSDGGAFGPVSLGYGSVDDLFGGAITGYGDILPALGGMLSGTPSLTDIILALNSILDPSLAAALPLDMSITDISDHIFFTLLDSNTVGFVSNLGLTIGGVSPAMASATFGGSLTLMAVPEPAGLGLLGLGLIGIVMIRRKKMAA